MMTYSLGPSFPSLEVWSTLDNIIFIAKKKCVLIGRHLVVIVSRIYTGATCGTQTCYHSGAPDLHGCHMWNAHFLPFRNTWFTRVPHMEHKLFTILEHLIYMGATCGTYTFYHSGAPNLHGWHMWNTSFLPFWRTWFTWVPHVEHKLFTIPEHLIYTGTTCGAQTFYHSGAPDLHGCHMWSTNFLPFRSTWFHTWTGLHKHQLNLKCKLNSCKFQVIF
jgi:hypothetical protein